MSSDFEASQEWTYKIEPNGPVVAVSHDETKPQQYQEYVALFEKPPSQDFVRALDSYRRTFFPCKEEKTLPWAMHRNIAKAKQKNNRIERAYAKRWPMAWYWKALFSELHRWTEHDRGKWFIKLSQVRDWTFASYYKEEDGETTLLRPPLFGRSDRLTLQDSYLNLLVFNEAVGNAWETASRETGYEGYRERTHVLGRTDFEYQLLDFECRDGGFFVTVRVKIDLFPFHVPAGDERMPKLDSLQDEDLPDGITYPYEMVWVPTYESGDGRAKLDSFLLASEPVCRAFEKLSEVWNDQTAESVLIIAPPGSGKELLANSAFSLRFFEKRKLFRLTLSTSDDSRNESLLYSWPHDDDGEEEEDAATIDDMSGLEMEGEPDSDAEDTNDSIEEADSHRGDGVYPGLIYKSRGGALFLDEIDKVSNNTRSGLLRVLENGEFAVPNTSMIVNVKNHEPLYIFAGSKRRDDMFRHEPPDFWTRISHVVEMEHPLDVDRPEDREQLARSYFRMFWIKHVFSFFEKRKLIRPKPAPTDPLRIDGEIREQMVMHLRWFLCEDVIKFFSNEFADEVCTGRERVEFSIRNIRTIVSRVVYAAFDSLSTNRMHARGIAEAERLWIHKEKSAEDSALWLRQVFGTNQPEDEEGLSERIRADCRRIVQSSIAKVFI